MTVEAIAQKQLDAYNVQDLDGHCACFADDVVICDLNGEPNLRGIEAYRARYEAMFAQFPQNRAELAARIVIGDTVIDHERVSRGPEGPVFEVAAIYTFAGDKIARVDFVKA